MTNKNLIEIAKRLGRNTLPDLPPSGDGTNPPPESGEFSLEDLTDSYRFSNINYRNGIYQVDFKKELLPAGTQDQHAEAAVEAKRNNQPRIADFPLYFALKHSLYKNRDNPEYKGTIKEARLFIKDSALKSWLMTSTRIIYNPKDEKDIVIHNYKQPDQYSLELETFIGPDCFITSKEAVNVESPLRALLDTSQSIQEINSIYKWLTDVDAYFYRVNSDRRERDERVARFYADSGRVFLLVCYGDSQDSYPAFGVKFAPQARAKKLRKI